MKLRLDLIQCLVQIPDGSGTGLTQVLKAGPSAITPPEMEVLRRLHNTEASGPERECVSRCRVVGHTDTDVYHETDRLAGIYKRKLIEYLFAPNSSMPETLADLNLPEECLDKLDHPEKQKAAKPKTAKQLRAALDAMDIEVPVGNISIPDLTALFPKAA